MGSPGAELSPLDPASLAQLTDVTPAAPCSSHPRDTQEKKGVQRLPAAGGRGGALSPQHPNATADLLAGFSMFSSPLLSRVWGVFTVWTAWAVARAHRFGWEAAFLLLMPTMCGSEPANTRLVLRFPNSARPKQWTTDTDDVSEQIKSEKSS